MRVLDERDVLGSRKGDADAVAKGLEGEVDDLERAGAVELGGEGVVVDGGLFVVVVEVGKEGEKKVRGGGRRLVFVDSAKRLRASTTTTEDRIHNFHSSRTSFTACARTDAARDEREASLGHRGAAAGAAARETREADRTTGAASNGDQEDVFADDIVACVFEFFFLESRETGE